MKHLLDLRVTHAVAAVTGLVLLVATSWPLTFDGLYTAPSSGIVILLVGSALLFGVVGGLVEGFAYRIGYRVVACLVLAIVSFPAFWLPALSIGRWGESDSPVETTDLSLAFAGWLLYAAVITAVSWATARLRNESRWSPLT